MPFYEYKCHGCGHCLEVLQKVSAPPLRQCPECHTEGLKKLVSAAGFILKGTGWYATDFKTPTPQQTPDEEGKRPDDKTAARPDATKDPGQSNTAAASTAPETTQKSTTDTGH